LLPLAALVLCCGCHYLGPAAYFRAVRIYEPRPVQVAEGQRDALRQRLKTVRSVAFAPPAGCSPATAGSADDSDTRTTASGIPCGLLMAELEGQALKAGFDVVSWRRGEPARSRAHLVLAVSESAKRVAPAARFVPGGDRYLVRSATPDGGQHALRVPRAGSVRKRCAARFEAAAAEPLAATTLELRAVAPHPKTQTATIWRYRRDFFAIEHGDGRLLAEQAVRARPRMAAPAVPALALMLTALSPAIVSAVMAEDGAYMGDYQMLAAGTFVAGTLAIVLTPWRILSYPDPADGLCLKRPAHWRPGHRKAARVARSRGRRFAREAIAALASARYRGEP